MCIENRARAVADARHRRHAGEQCRIRWCRTRPSGWPGVRGIRRMYGDEQGEIRTRSSCRRAAREVGRSRVTGRCDTGPGRSNLQERPRARPCSRTHRRPEKSGCRGVLEVDGDQNVADQSRSDADESSADDCEHHASGTTSARRQRSRKIDGSGRSAKGGCRR